MPYLITEDVFTTSVFWPEEEVFPVSDAAGAEDDTSEEDEVAEESPALTLPSYLF